jgi:hypothetical protein
LPWIEWGSKRNLEERNKTLKKKKREREGRQRKGKASLFTQKAHRSIHHSQHKEEERETHTLHTVMWQERE